MSESLNLELASSRKGRKSLGTANYQREVESIELDKQFDKLEKFLVGSYSLVSTSFDGYVEGNRPRKRLITIILIKLFGGFISFIRCAVSISINTSFIRRLMSDANYIMGNRYIISLIMASGGLGMCIAIGGFTVWMEMRSKLVAIEYFHEMRAQFSTGYMSAKYRKKFYKKLKFTTQYISWPLLFFLGINATMVFCLPPYIAHSRPDSIYSLWSIIFWTICTVILCYDFYNSLFGMFILIYLCAIYLKYMFDQVNDQIWYSYQRNDRIQLKKCILQHNSLCMTTNKLNSLFKNYIYILYIICKPGLNSLLYTTLSPESNVITRVTTTSMFIITTFLIFTINIICSSVSRSAHRPTNALYMICANIKLPLSLKLKVRAMIDKLSGPKIGFYCSDLYPMTRYDFYQDIWSFATFYILLVSFLRTL